MKEYGFECYFCFDCAKHFRQEDLWREFSFILRGKYPKFICGLKINCSFFPQCCCHGVVWGQKSFGRYQLYTKLNCSYHLMAHRPMFSDDLRRLHCLRVLKEWPKHSDQNQRQHLWKESAHQFHNQDKYPFLDILGIFEFIWSRITTQRILSCLHFRLSRVKCWNFWGH